MIFDFDGTLVDSASVWQSINSAVLKRHGVNDEEKILKYFTVISGKSFDEDVDIAIEMFNLKCDRE